MIKDVMKRRVGLGTGCLLLAALSSLLKRSMSTQLSPRSRTGSERQLGTTALPPTLLRALRSQNPIHLADQNKSTQQSTNSSSSLPLSPWPPTPNPNASPAHLPPLGRLRSRSRRGVVARSVLESKVRCGPARSHRRRLGVFLPNALLVRPLRRRGRQGGEGEGARRSRHRRSSQCWRRVLEDWHSLLVRSLRLRRRGGGAQRSERAHGG